MVLPSGCRLLMMIAPVCSTCAEEDKQKWGHKILMGLNFYGYDYNGQGAKEAVTGKNVLKLLDKHGPDLQWHREHFEHFFEYDGLVSIPARWHHC